MKVFYIDCCIRGEVSRTRRLANAFLEEFGAKTDRLYLDETELIPLDGKALERRAALLEEGDFSDPSFALSKQFASAEFVVVAAPLWDMGVPAKLKTYFEQVSVGGITFRETADGDCVGCCQAKNLVFLTTRGMDLPDGHVMEQATPYLKALSMFFGIPDFHAVSAWGLDMVPPDEVEARLRAAEEEARALARMLRPRAKERLKFKI